MATKTKKTSRWPSSYGKEGYPASTPIPYGMTPSSFRRQQQGTSPPIFTKFDAGLGERLKGADTGDCQVRALTRARSMGYRAAWDLLYTIQGETRACSFDLVKSLSDEDPRLGAIRKIAFPAVSGQPRMTGREFVKLHPHGRFILRMAHHVAAIVDGTIYDTHDSSKRCVYTAWEVSEVDSV